MDYKIKVVACEHCGVKNRVTDYSLSRAPVCGNCHRRLQESLFVRSLRLTSRREYKFGIVAVLLVCAALIGYYRSSTGGASSSYARTDLATQPQLPSRGTGSGITKVNYPQQPITQGVHSVLAHSEFIAPFRIKVPSDGNNYLVKLEDAESGKSVMTIYVLSGQTVEAKVPLGTYRMKYATGSTWYGDVHLFGPNTQYAEADKKLTFSRNGNEISGHTVELIPQLYGNLSTTKISGKEF